MSGPERISGIAIIPEIPVMFSRVMFAPAILATVYEFADYYRKEIARLRLIARYAAVTAGLWIRSWHGTWRFFLVTPDSLAAIDRKGKRPESGQTIPYPAGIAPGEGGSTPSYLPGTSRIAPQPVKGPVVPCFPHPLKFRRERFAKTRNPGRNNRAVSEGNRGGRV
jgi:hypothetical protein